MRKNCAALCRAASLFLLTAAFSSLAAAQPPAASENEREQVAAARAEPKNEFAVWSGFAPDIPRLYSGSRRSAFGEIGLRYSRRIAAAKNLTLKYRFDIIPLAVLSYRRELLVNAPPAAFPYDRDRATAYGAGIIPINFQLNFRRRRSVQPYLTAEAGFLRFSESLPDDRSRLRPERRGRQFNFALAGGGGVEFAANSERSYFVGFKFHHISNAQTGNINPGFDQNLFYVGYTFKKF